MVLPEADLTAPVSPSTPCARRPARGKSCRTAPGSSTSPESASTSNMPTARRATWSSGARSRVEGAPRIRRSNMWPSCRTIGILLLLERRSSARGCGRAMAVCTSAIMLRGAARFVIGEKRL